MGKAVVTTSIGCEGLDTRDGWNALIRDDPGEFAAAIKLVLEDDALAARLGANARATAEKTYSWNSIGAKMRTLYASLTDADVRSRASNG
jgi:glycosyltransferase involved in cell wall biosynthesis